MSDLAFIQLQLWIVIGLLLFFMVGNILCRIFGCGEAKEVKWGEMFDRGEIDTLLEKTQSRLRTHPHDVGALYYGARALVAKDRYPEARALLDRLSVIEPSLRETCQREISDIDHAVNGG